MSRADSRPDGRVTRVTSAVGASVAVTDFGENRLVRLVEHGIRLFRMDVRDRIDGGGSL